MSNGLIILAVLMAVAAVLWPRQGVVARWRSARRLAERVRREDAIKHILKREVNGSEATIESLAGHLQIPANQTVAVLDDLETRGLLTFEGGRLHLKPAGRELALHVIRAHRLWEHYLSEETGVAEAEWHRQAERKEHLLSPQEADALAARLGHPTLDPHGDIIPEPGRPVAADLGIPLNAAELNQPLRVTHVEDEPSAIYAQLTAQGIRTGMRGLLVEKLPHRIRFWADGNEHVLAPVIANNISVEPLADYAPRDLLDEEYLSGLAEGQRGKVLGLSPACRGPERRRLLDLGFVPGTEVLAEMKSPGGDPTAYRVRGTLIALRR
ncbi:MAG: metal-dependent transcriptional regulator, partial [Verrucomicrobia bacterium]|nr:metal-dependent transcriptional regulator [Verrucomicrobiota bacterium]